MSFFNIAPGQEAQQLDRGLSNPATSDDMAAAWYGGIPTGILDGTRRAVYKAQSLFEDAALAPAASVDKRFGTNVEPWLRAEAETTNARLKEMQSDPYTVGKVGQILAGAAEPISLVTIGTLLTGNPIAGLALAAGTLGHADIKEGLEQGLDPTTAIKRGAIVAAQTAIGGVLPVAYGAKTALSIAIATGVNVGVGMTGRSATASMLSQAGYHDMAEQYKMLDTAAIATDAIFALAFGGYHHGKAAIVARAKAAVPKPKQPGAPELPSEAPPGEPPRPPGAAPEIDAANAASETAADETMAGVGELEQQIRAHDEKLAALQAEPPAPPAAPELATTAPGAEPPARPAVSVITAPNGHTIHVDQADTGALSYVVHRVKGGDDPNPLQMVLDKAGRLVTQDATGEAWIPPFPEVGAEMRRLLEKRAATPGGGNPERYALDRKIAALAKQWPARQPPAPPPVESPKEATARMDREARAKWAFDAYQRAGLTPEAAAAAVQEAQQTTNARGEIMQFWEGKDAEGKNQVELLSKSETSSLQDPFRLANFEPGAEPVALDVLMPPKPSQAELDAAMVAAAEKHAAYLAIQADTRTANIVRAKLEDERRHLITGAPRQLDIGSEKLNLLDDPNSSPEQIGQALTELQAEMPRLMYHATHADFVDFEIQAGEPIFFAEQPRDAFKVVDHKHGYIPEGTNTRPAYVWAKNPFDYTNAKDAQALADHLEKNVPNIINEFPRQTDDDGQEYQGGTLADHIGYGNWQLIEHPVAQEWIKAQGFDGFYDLEHWRDAERSLAVFSPDQIKSVFAPPLERMVYQPQKGLTKAERAVERNLAARPLAELEAEYAKLKDAELGKVLSTDVARELSPLYLADRPGMGRAVHEPMSALIKGLYAKALAIVRPPGQDNVLFTAGGAGAGKTTGLENIPEMALAKKESQIVYDTNMNGYKSAKSKIEQALAADKPVTIVHVYRDTIDALGGAMHRAMNQAREFHGPDTPIDELVNGRTVPLGDFLDTHVGSRQVILRLAQEYADNPNVKFRFIDNTRGPGKSVLVPIEFLAKQEHNEAALIIQLRQRLEDARAKKEISEPIYRGFLQGQPENPPYLAAADARGLREPDLGRNGQGDQRGGQGPPEAVADETDGATPPAPGAPFIVYRLGSKEPKPLENVNAGNADGVALHLARVQAGDGAKPSGGTGDTVHAYRVTIAEQFGDYSTLNKRTASSDEHVGRRAEKSAVAYSFPGGGKFTAEHIGSVPLSELHAELGKQGYADFDASGSDAGAAAIRSAFAPKPAAPELPAIRGKADTVRIGEEYQPVTWAVVDADAIAPTLTKGENQARDRTRAASEVQVNKIAANLDFRLLEESPLMDFGAPTLAADGRIVGGNGRVEAIRRAYSAGGADTYAAELRAAAAKYGLDPAAIEGVAKPVLVRVLDPGVNVREAALASNEGAGMKLSMLEQAPVDAERLPPLAGMYVPEDGNLNAAGNRGFIMNWIEQMPGTEQAALVDANGTLSQEGLLRMRNAILFKAYGDSPTLARMVEAVDQSVKNANNALTKAAPPVAAAEAAIALGDLHDVSPLPDLLAAVEKFAELRDNNLDVETWVKQVEILDETLTPEAREMLSFLGKHARSARAMGDFIAGMYRGLERAGNPKVGDMLGGGEPTVMHLIELGKVEADGPGILAGSLFDAPDAFPGKAGAPRSKDSALHEAQSRAEQAESEAPLMETAANCAKAA